MLKQNVLIPPDVRKVASATSLRVLYADKIKQWTKGGTIIKWITKMQLTTRKRFENNQNKKPESDTLPPIKSTSRISLVSPDPDRRSKTPERVRLDLSAPEDTWERQKEELVNHAGNHFKKTRRHQPLPVLPKPISYQPQVSGWWVTTWHWNWFTKPSRPDRWLHLFFDPLKSTVHVMA